jgi:hypothetical protein
MSHRTLERLFVRLLFDPSFVEALHADADAALAGLDLASHERDQLLAVDRRAWGHDPLRRLRSLRTLVDEFKTSTTLALAATRSTAALDSYFSSREFHDAVQHRGSMALSFADFLDRIARERGFADTRFTDALALETALARCRREIGGGYVEPSGASLPLDRETRLRLAPGHAIGRYDANVVEVVNAVERYLFEVGLMPAVALCDDAPRLAGLPPLAGTETYLLALPSSTGVSLMPVDDDYGRVLEAFAAGTATVGEASDRAISRGVLAEDISDMLESLAEERVLVSADSPTG